MRDARGGVRNARRREVEAIAETGIWTQESLLRLNHREVIGAHVVTIRCAESRLIVSDSMTVGSCDYQ